MQNWLLPRKLNIFGYYQNLPITTNLANTIFMIGSCRIYCDGFIVAYFSNIYFTKDALKAYKKLSYDDKRTLIDDLEKLNNYILNKWTNDATFLLKIFQNLQV
jgi:hypothetical protein